MSRAEVVKAAWGVFGVSEDHSLGLHMGTWHQSNAGGCGRGSHRHKAAAQKGGEGWKWRCRCQGETALKPGDWTRSARSRGQLQPEAETGQTSQTHFRTPKVTVRL